MITLIIAEKGKSITELFIARKGRKPIKGDWIFYSTDGLTHRGLYRFDEVWTKIEI